MKNQQLTKQLHEYKCPDCTYHVAGLPPENADNIKQLHPKTCPNN